MHIFIKNCRNWFFQRLNIIANLTAENVALRHQLAVLNRRQKHPVLKDSDRLLRVFLSRICSDWRNTLKIVQPDNVVRWYKKSFKIYFDYYHGDRTHLDLEKEPPIERPISNQRTSSAQLLELPCLCGLHHRYEWKEAA